jgi:hypothetical protein
MKTERIGSDHKRKIGGFFAAAYPAKLFTAVMHRLSHAAARICARAVDNEINTC